MIEQYEDSGESAMAGAMESWLTTKEELGSFVKVESSSTEFKDKQYVCSVNASFEKRALDATIVFTKQGDAGEYGILPRYTPLGRTWGVRRSIRLSAWEPYSLS